MKIWLPLTVVVVLSFLLNAFPLFMAFVVKDEGWGQAGWALYFYTIPLTLLLLVLGTLTTIVLFLQR
jgi:hypothetical protein